ncbi:TPR-like protein [Nadsonia fulvescens var. elongata DSM 6958]|uniref:TPR-like protein n=1 Tax=Nadsonia fulvescens var. elongata DSM 6958 TaxID=857566 RepID=A0A1E3PGW3_9ASCO|nr:TPR-like protein [Nadsonia fulvescens var. elongata DSM 6958]
MSVTQTKKDLVLGFVDFLQTSINNGTIASDDCESVEVAIECLSEVFNLEGVTKEQVYGNTNLLSLFEKSFKKEESSSQDNSTAAADTAPVDRDAAERAKLEGNRFMSQKQFESAIVSYTRAIELDATNAIYLSNRAAAYSNLRQHELAVADATRAIELDPNYSKAYSRLGLAKYALGDAQASLRAYKKGMEVEGEQCSDAMKRGYETAKKRVEEELASASPANAESADGASTERSGDSVNAPASAPGFPDLASLGNMFGGAGGGMPDLSALMGNPQVRAMAQNLMSDPSALNNLMANPALQNMASQFSSGGGMPNMADMMANPDLQNLARSFMGGENNQ